MSFAVQSAADFVADRPTSPTTVPPTAVELLAQITEWDTHWNSVWEQRPENVSDEAWCCFVKDAVDKFAPGQTVKVEKQRSGRLVAKGKIDGRNSAYMWPEKHVLAEVATDGASSDWLGAETPTRFNVMRSDEFVDRPRMRWIVQGVLPEAEIAIIYGESGSGKSFLAYDLAASIARGQAWNGRKVTRGKVCIVAAEGAAGMRNRVEAFQLKSGASHNELPAIIADAPDLLDSKDVALLAKQLVDAGQFSLIILDTLSSCHSGNENAGEDMGKVITNCKFIHKMTGALVCLIHHLGKREARGPRGWSGLRAAADVQIEVARTGDNRTWTLDKLKDGEDGAGYGFRLVSVPLGVDIDGNAVSSCVVEHCATTTPVRGPVATGEFECATMRAARASESDEIDVDDLLDAVKSQIPHVGTGRDQRKTSFNKALKRLCKKSLLYVKEGSDGSIVRLTRAVATDTFERAA